MLLFVCKPVDHEVYSHFGAPMQMLRLSGGATSTKGNKLDNKSCY